MHTQKQNKRAFTLVELLIVITVIGILFVVLITRVDFATDKARATGVETDFNAYKIAFQMAAMNHNGFDYLFENTDAVEAESGVLLKPAQSAAENLMAALNDMLDDTMDLSLAYGEKADPNERGYVGIPCVTEITADEIDNADACVKAVYYTEYSDPWKEPYIIYYCAGQQEIVTIDGEDVIHDVADGTIHGNRGCICMVSKGANVDEEIVWDNGAIDSNFDMDDAFVWEDGMSKGDVEGYLFSGAFVPAVDSDDYVLVVSYTFRNGQGETAIHTFGFDGDFSSKHGYGNN